MAGLLTKAAALGTDVERTAAVRFLDHRLPDVHLHSSTANFGRMLNFDVEAGRYFTDGEAHTAQDVAVIGADVKEELFPQLDPLGRPALVDGLPCRVVG